MLLVQIFSPCVVLLFSRICDANELILFQKTNLKNGDNLLMNCVRKIINANFINTPTVLIHDNRDKRNVSNMFYDRLNTYLVSEFIPRILVEEFIYTNSTYVLDGSMLFIKHYNDCENILNAPSDKMNEKIKYLVIIFDFSKHVCTQIFENVGRKLSKFDITYIIKMADEDDYKIVTFIPEMDPITCRIQNNIPATTLSNCSSEEDFIAFPLKKPQDLMKCPFKVGMASLFPFTKIENQTSLKTLDPIEEHNGSDFETLKIMAKYFNFSLEYFYILRREENPYVIQDFLGFLLNGTLDACAGGLYNIYGDRVDYSGVYGRQAVIWMYPASRVTRSWQNLVSKVNGLYIFVIFYGCHSVIWYLFCMYDKKAVSISNMLLYSWGALIGTSSLLEAASLKQKILNIVYLILCIHLSAYISVQIYSFLTIVGPPIIYKTNTELIASGLKPYLISLTKYFVSDKAYEAFANTSEECDTFAHCVEKSMEYNGVTVIIDGLFTRLQARTAVNDEARTLRVTENLLTVYHEMILRKDVTINKKFRNVLLRLSEAGILERLYYESVGILTWAKAKSASKNIMSYSYSCEVGCSITLEQAAGAFYLLFIGCGLSFCVFIVEVLIKRERGRGIPDVSELHFD